MKMASSGVFFGVNWRKFCPERNSCGSNGSKGPSMEDIDAVIGGMSVRVSDEMSETLSQPYTADELKLAISQILITDNVLVAYEINHYLAHKYGGFNGRGLRQGDPLSPYMFLLCAEALSHLISLEEERGTIRGVSVNCHGPRVSHLLFTDDTLIIFQAFHKAFRSLTHVLTKFEKASVLLVNLEKSSVAFSRNTPADLREELANVMGTNVVARHERYLGLPAAVSRSKTMVFQNLVDMVWAKLQSWKCKNLSQVEKVVLLKSMVQAIPMYVMSCFLVPVSVCRTIKALMANFLWHNKNTKKIHWLAWDKVSVRKEEGGLGLRKIGAFNRVMLAKQLWRVMAYLNNLLSRIWKQRYFATTELSAAIARPGSSFTWRSILVMRDLLAARSRWHIGQGRSVNIWTDCWIPRPITFQVITAPNCLSLQATVSELIREDGEWNKEIIREVFRPEDVSAILAIPLMAGSQDCLRWHFEKHGRYSVHSGYRLLSQGFVSDGYSYASASSSCSLGSWNFIWKAEVPPKVRLFIWRVCRNLLPTSVNLSCMVCNSDDPEVWIRGLYRNLDKPTFGRALIRCWLLWWARNVLIFENSKVSAPRIIDRVRGLEVSIAKKHLAVAEREQSRQASQGIPFLAKS
ncbi:UNVERIFIED_CONTAM: putative mitochondrial protein [Sesamum radiatum]|uniref:Mitochondrial protein n=1 Tax=Sesamum radiatum TaxID=300843 RepID=A0AAW2T4V6_SESRA